MVVLTVCLANVEAACSMKYLPKIDGEYIHYVLSWDCILTVTRSWDGNSLAEFNLTSSRHNICKSGRVGKLIHYVQVDYKSSLEMPHLVFIIYFRRERTADLHSWRVIRINITSITYRKRFQRTILDSFLGEYSTLYTKHPLRTCTYNTRSILYCFWQNGTEHWVQVYRAATNDGALTEYRTVGEEYHLEGHPLFGDIVGSLPGPEPRLLMFDYSTRDWLYEIPMLTNLIVSGRRIQEMRQTGKIKGSIGQVAAMDAQSFIVNDCADNLCEYRYSSLGLTAKAATMCIFTSPYDVASGVFKMPRRFSIPLQSRWKKPSSMSFGKLPGTTSPPFLKIRQEIATEQWYHLLEYTMIIIYALTVAMVFLFKILIEIHISILSPDEIPFFERSATTFYTYLLPGLIEGPQ